MNRRDLIQYPDSRSDSRLEIVSPSGQAVLWKDCQWALAEGGPSSGTQGKKKNLTKVWLTSIVSQLVTAPSSSAHHR